MRADIRWLCLSWAPYSRRSQVFAESLGGAHHCVHYLRYQTPVYAPAKYILQAIRSLQILFRERPQAVYAQSPPVFCGMVVDLYSRWSHTPFVHEFHSAVLAEKWLWALPLQRVLARRATTNIVTNKRWAEMVHGWGANAIVMGDPFLPLSKVKNYPLQLGFNLVFVASWGGDEPVEAVIEAARDIENLNLYITGSPRRPKSFFQNLPSNVRCTGFLPNELYAGLLQSADAVIALTTRDFTLQLGGLEAVSSGKPLITSDWPFLQEFFRGGTVFVDNTGSGIREGILYMMHKYRQLASEVVKFREHSRKTWNAQLAELNNIVQQAMESGRIVGKRPKASRNRNCS